MSCFSYACSRCPENSPLTIGINLEIADILNKFKLSENAEQYLKQAINQSTNSLSIRLHCLELLASCYINSGKN